MSSHENDQKELALRKEKKIRFTVSVAVIIIAAIAATGLAYYYCYGESNVL